MRVAVGGLMHETNTYARAATTLADFEAYQFARLCQYLRGRAPTARVAYTILIYRLSDAEVMKALYEPVPIR